MCVDLKFRHCALLGVLLLSANAVPAGDSYHLARASVDHGGGGYAESINYQLNVAIGQHDADVISNSAIYRYSGGVLAQVPDDVLFKNGFEGD